MDTNMEKSEIFLEYVYVLLKLFFVLIGFCESW